MPCATLHTTEKKTHNDARAADAKPKLRPVVAMSLHTRNALRACYALCRVLPVLSYLVTGYLETATLLAMLSALD